MTNISLLEDKVNAARDSGDFSAVWNCLVATDFYVLIAPRDTQKPNEDFVLEVRSFGPGQEPTVFASEALERLSVPGSSKATKMRGAELIAMLTPELGIAVILHDDVLGLPADLVNDLRASIRAAV